MDTPAHRSVQATLTRDDFLLAQASLQKASGPAWLGPVLSAVAAAVGFGVIAAPAALLELPAVYVAPVALLAALALAWLVATRMMRKQLVKSLRADGAFLRPFKLTAEPDKLVIESDVGRTEWLWRGVLAIDLTEDQILIRTDGMAGVIVPKAAFADFGAMRSFAEHLRTLKRQAVESWALAPARRDLEKAAS